MILAVLATSLAVIPGLAGAAVQGATSAHVPRLAGRVTLTGSSSGFLTVYLPHSLAAGQVGRIHYSFHGAGHFLGVALCATAAHSGYQGSPALFALSGPAGSRWGAYQALPRGSYRLYFVSDAPGRVTMTIPGLTGTASLRPSATFSVPIAALRIRQTKHRPNGVTILGETHMLSSAGVAIGYIYAQHSLAHQGTPSLDHLEFCSYIGGDKPAGKKAYAPGCEGAGAGGSYLVTDGYASGIVGSNGPVAVGLGGNLKSLDPNPHIQAYGIWLSFPPQG